MSQMQNPEDPRLWKRHRGKLLLLVLAILVIWGVSERVLTRAALARSTEEAALPDVVLVHASHGQGGEDLVLPAELRAYNEASIYARTSGYLRAWHTDIGTAVKKGQLLAEIDTPEIDQQLAQAQADLASAQANEELARSTSERWQQLLQADSVSHQEAEQKAGDAAAKRAALASAKANLARLRDLESFKRVLAPFDGVVVARNTDIGALINAGQNSGAELFRIADTHALRVYVQLPQPYAALAQPGVPAQLRFSERPGQSFEARLVRSAGAFDPQTRSLQAELELDNSRYHLLPGAYGEAHFKLPEGSTGSLRLPANTVLFRSEGLQVAVVDAQQRVHLRSIHQGRDFGGEIEVLDGIRESDQVVLNPPDSLRDGARVRPVATAKAAS